MTQTCAWGGTWAPTDVSASVVRGAVYTAEVFHGGRTTPTYTLSKTVLGTPVALNRAHQARWPVLTDAAMAAARPLAGQTALDLAWTGTLANQLEVTSATVTLANSGASVATPDEPVLRGSSQVTVAPGGEIQSAPVGGATSQRGLLLNLRTWDGTARSLWFSYDTGN